jgi:signal peptidase II
LVVVADQLTKLWIRSNLLVGESLFEAGIFQIVRVQNTGSSFGLFKGHSFALIIVAFVGIAFLLVFTLFLYRRFFPVDNLLGRLALGLILGGTIGNLIDRLRFDGVTDFISLGWWPAFNIADSAIVVGAIIFACSLLILAVKKR